MKTLLIILATGLAVIIARRLGRRIREEERRASERYDEYRRANVPPHLWDY